MNKILFPVLLIATILISGRFSPPSQAQSCPDISGDRVNATVDISSPGTYKVWSRIMAPDSTNNSYHLQIDSNCAITVGDSSSIPANTWVWVGYQDGNIDSPITMSLTQGTHTVTLASLESNVKIDKILFASDFSCVPTDFGNNCTGSTVTPTNTPAPVATATPTTAPASVPFVLITNPTNGSTVPRRANITITADASSASGIDKVEFLIDNKVTCTDTTAPYSCSWDVPPANRKTYTVTARAYDKAGNQNTNSIYVTAR